MKKLIALLIFTALFVVSNSNYVQAGVTGNLIDGDFSTGLPSGWSIENSSGTKQYDDFLRIFGDDDTNQYTEVRTEVGLPSGTYELNFSKLYASSNFADANMKIYLLYPDGSSFDSVTYDYPSSDGNIIFEVPETSASNAFGYLAFEFYGGLNQTMNEYDYMDVGNLELYRHENISYMDTVTLSGPIDLDKATVSDPTQFTATNLSNASVYVQTSDSPSKKYVEGGVPITDWTYDERTTDYKLSNTTDSLLLHFDSNYGVVQGDVTADYPDEYPIEATIVMYDDTLDEGFEYSLEDYYLFQWTIPYTGDYSNTISKDFGPEQYYTKDRIRKATVILEKDTEKAEVLKHGFPTERPITGISTDIVFDEYEETSDNFILRDSVELDRILFYEDTDIIPYGLPNWGEEVTVRMYLPHDSSTIESPGGTPYEPSNPGGSADLLATVLGAFGLNTPNGHIVFVVLTLIAVIIILVMTNITGIALPIVVIALLGLFYYAGFVPFWVMLTLTTVLVLMFVGLRGGMQRYE